MKYVLSLVVLVCIGWHSGYGQAKYEKYFSRYEILHMSDSSVLKINTGSCGATFYDMNGDGKDDLVVGEFGEVLCPGQDPKEKKPFVQGRCRVYLNYGTKECPVYKDFKWLETNGQPLYVPITCCVPMVPAFADIDGDGVDELFSGCYPGDIYMWKKGANGEYVDQVIIKLADGKPINIGNASTVFPGDVDGDGKIDLLIAGLYDGLFWARNTGTKEVFRFEKVERMNCNLGEEKIGVNHAVLYDWDGDGKLDIVFGAGYGGNVSWCRNLGDGTYAEPEILVERPEEVSAGLEPGQGHGDKPKICIYDYDGDGKEDLVLATEVWENTGCEMTPDLFEKLIKDERLVKPRKTLDALVKKMRKYTDNIPENSYTEPDSRIPKDLYEKWLAANNEYDGLMKRIMNELTGGSTNLNGIIWVYYRK